MRATIAALITTKNLERTNISRRFGFLQNCRLWGGYDLLQLVASDRLWASAPQELHDAAQDMAIRGLGNLLVR